MRKYLVSFGIQSDEKLEDEELPLEEAFTEYSKGVKLIAEANKKVDQVEKKVQKLLDNGETEDFE